MTYSISVVIPVYNVAPYIRKCIDSLVHSTVLPYEVILVDDGSTDGSDVICDEYAKKYPYITTIHQPNGGPSVARNTGTTAATGDYILYVDGDDWIDKNWLQSYTEILANAGGGGGLCALAANDGLPRWHRRAC